MINCSIKLFYEFKKAFSTFISTWYFKNFSHNTITSFNCSYESIGFKCCHTFRKSMEIPFFHLA